MHTRNSRKVIASETKIAVQSLVSYDVRFFGDVCKEGKVNKAL